MSEYATAAKYHQFIREKKLMGLQCKECGHKTIPPRPICLNCGSTSFEWVEFKQEGNLTSFTEIHVVGAKWVNEAPILIGIVELEGGERVTARLYNVKQKDIKIGMFLKAIFVEGPNEIELDFQPK